MRNLRFLTILRAYGSGEMRREGLSMVALLTDQAASAHPESEEKTYTLVLVGPEGRSERIEFGGALPAEVASLFPTR
jgi:hypothetical protein